MVKLEDLLKFFSGSTTVPILGFVPRPVLEFTDGQLATAATCDMIMRLPMGHPT